MNKQEVIKQLENFYTLSSNLSSLVKDYENLDQLEIKEAQTQLKQLKESLNTEYKRTRTSKSLSDIEQAFYQPAIQGAWANSLISKIRWDSAPNYEMNFIFSLTI
ncbi:MAG: hypothetical protein VKJ04_04745 [Vampirovibrionales bacterium]|nr:hypothetical protein [Vampirovibrionales bacterium]